MPHQSSCWDRLIAAKASASGAATTSSRGCGPAPAACRARRSSSLALHSIDAVMASATFAYSVPALSGWPVCFSGSGGRSVLAEGTRPLVTKVDLGHVAAKHLVVFTASGPDEVTGTAKEQGHGLFTYYFLKGLNGAAHGSKKGVTVQDLYDYLRPQVEDAARRDNRDQSPQLFVPPEGQRQFLIEDLR